jgi:hypothetical protein
MLGEQHHSLLVNVATENPFQMVPQKSRKNFKSCPGLAGGTTRTSDVIGRLNLVNLADLVFS